MEQAPENGKESSNSVHANGSIDMLLKRILDNDTLTPHIHLKTALTCK